MAAEPAAAAAAPQDMPQHKSEAFEDRKRRKELAEARQSGKAAPEIDVESGKMINPHNPEYITKRPWYLGESGPSLNHHAVQKKNHLLTMHEADAVARQRKKVARQDAKLEKGMWVEALFKAKNPWLPAKVLRVNLDGSADVEFENGKVQRKTKREHVKTAMAFGSMVGIEQEGKMAFDAKRDRWHGYDPSQHKQTIDRYNRMDDARRKRRQAKRDEKFRRKQEAKARALDAKKAKKAAATATAITTGGGGGSGTSSGGGKRRRTADGSGSDSPPETDSGTDSDGTAARARRRAADSDEIESGASDMESADSDSDSDYDSDAGSDEEEEEDDSRDFLQRDVDATDFQKRIARQGGIGGAQMKTTVRNLRIREDTAKYLRNLDPNSAYYDPKTRAMRENPLPNENPEDIPFAGDNFERYSGDTIELAKTSLFAWEADGKNPEVAINVVADPSRVEFMRRKFEDKRQQLQDDKQQAVIDKYGDGGAEQLDEGHDLKRMAFGSSEHYVEYARDGRVVRGAAKAVAKSKYAEDVLTNNHTAIWGSYFDKRSFRWGYGDDHSLVQNSYSTGVEGRAANDHAAAGLPTVMATTARPALVPKTAEEREKSAASSSAFQDRNKLYGEQLAPELDKDKLKAALANEDKFQRDADRHAAEADDKKRKYNSMATTEVTPEEIEAWRIKRGNAADPMKDILTSDTLLDYEPEDDKPKKRKK